MEDELKLDINEDGSITISGKTTAKDFKAQIDKLREMGIQKLGSNTESKFSDIVQEMPIGKDDGYDKFIRVCDLKDFIHQRIEECGDSQFAQLKIMHDILCYGEVGKDETQN